MNSRCKHADCIEVFYSNSWTFYAPAGSKRELNYSLLLSGSRFTVPSFPVRWSGSRSYAWKNSLMGGHLGFKCTQSSVGMSIKSRSGGWFGKRHGGQRKILLPPTAIIPWSAPRAFHRLLEIFQKVSLDLSKSCSTVAFCDKSCSKKKQNFFGLMLKYANCTAKVRFLSILCNFAI